MLLTHNETSTGVTNPIAALAAAVRGRWRPGALILVDAISGLGAVPFETDAWGLDVVVTGSQKAGWCRPACRCSRFRRAPGRPPSAPACRASTSTSRRPGGGGKGPDAVDAGGRRLFQVDAGLGLMEAEGYPAVFARHAACAAATRAGLAALGFRLLADPATPRTP